MSELTGDDERVVSYGGKTMAVRMAGSRLLSNMDTDGKVSE